MSTLKKIIGSKYFQIGLSIVLLTLLFQMIDFEDFSHQVRNAEVKYLILTLVLVTCNRLLMPIKWNLLLLAKKRGLDWWDAIRVYYVSTFFGLFLPATVGADALRAYYARKQGVAVAEGLASILVERVLGLIVLLVFGVLGCLLLILYIADLQFDALQLTGYAVVLSGLVISAFAFTLSERFGGWVERAEAYLERKSVAPKITTKLVMLHSAYAEYRKHKLAMLMFFVLTCAETILPIMWSYFVGLSLGVDDVPFAFYFAFVPVTLLLIRLPISLDGFGVNEASYVYFLGMMGVASATGFAIGLVSHVLFIVGLLPGLLFYLLQRRGYREVIETAADT